MKKLFKVCIFFVFLTGFSSVSAQNYYEQQWKKIETNSKSGTVKSNLPLIQEIEKQAMKDNNAVELIKALKSEFAILNSTQNDDQNNTVSQFFAKLQTTEKKLKGEEQLFFKTMLSSFFMDYFQRNSWKINQRTNIDNADFSQIETWSKLDFKNQILKTYQELDAQKSDIAQLKIQKYKAVFNNTKDVEYFPSVLDWYSMEKIQFFGNSRLFTKNELQENYKKINAIYDELIARNSGNSKLYFSHQKINNNCVYEACKDKLVQLQNLYNSSTDGDYKLIIASDIMEVLSADKKNIEALEWAKKAKVAYPESPFVKNIENKENQITNPTLILNYERETQSNLPIHIVAEHKNISQFSLSIYEVKTDFQNFIEYSRNPSKSNFNKLKKNLVRKDEFSVPNQQDYLSYKTSLEVKPLPSGIYVVEYKVNNDSQTNNENKTYYFIASNNRVIYKNKSEDKPSQNILKLVNNENGKSLNNESLVVNEYVSGKTLVKTEVKTSGDGAFSIPQSANKQYYRLYLIQQPKTNDFQLISAYGNRDYENYNPSKDQQTLAQIFIDRGIYRPGQTVYFKVINTQLNVDKESVTSGLKQKITLFDANGQEVSSQNFTTNEFGSYHGSFILPKGSLNGDFRLSIDNKTAKYFDVEEYKRPKFEVTFEPVKDEYKYGQTIQLKGKAMMFSGVALSNTTVNYEIKKQNIRWKYFPWYPRGNDNENSILGNVTTDEKGEFSIQLDLKKEEKIEGIQIDNYGINASVTDINGETQTADTNLKVASVSHYIKAEELNNKFSDENVGLKVETKNYNEQDVNKSYRVKLSKLEVPNRVFRSNFDSQIQNLSQLSKDDFIKKFPHDLFDKNDEQKNWKKTIVFEKSQEPRTKSQELRVKNQDSKPSTNNQQPATHLDLGKLEAGDYLLELYNIEGKDTIKTQQYFSVWDKKSLKNNQKPFLKVVAPKTEVERGSKAEIYVYSAIPNALVNIFYQNGDGKTISETKSLKNGVLKYETPIPNDKKVGQLMLQFQLVAFNDVQTQTVNLQIKDSEKPLRIETITFRDKLQPNSKEKWSVKILGNDKEKINAEVLTNMYDMSLDQFARNDFEWQKMYSPFYQFSYYDERNDLRQIYYQKRLKYATGKNVNILNFNWLNFNERIIMRSMKSTAIPAPSAVADTMSKNTNIEEVVMVGYGSAKKEAYTGSVGIVKDDESERQENLENIPVRQNLNETAFFYPDLKTDAEGNVNFEFTSPEALTKWKLMFLAHTKDARAATLEKEVVTQKEFSVTPNYPRFLREGDELTLQTKLSNLTDKKLNGVAQLQILDAFTNENISEKFGITQLGAAKGYNIENSFALQPYANEMVSWKLKAPNNISSIIIKVVAKAGAYSDGEQQGIAILPNRMLVTDAVPVFVKEGETKTFVLENLKNNVSTTASNVSNTLELTTNPIWEVLFALPSLKNDQNTSADVIFNKWFADVLASEVFKANPRMKTVFEEYQNKGLLNSNLEKNQELKQLLLEETPWVLDSKNEEEQMQKITLLFDANTMRNSIKTDWDTFAKLQNPDGGFSWQAGYPSSYYVSLYLLKNLGKLNSWLKTNVKDYQNEDQKMMVSKLVKYVDQEMEKYYTKPKDNLWSNFNLDYLDTRNYWEKEYPLKSKGNTLKTAFKNDAKNAKFSDFTFFGLHRVAILFNDYGLKDLSSKYMKYLKETSVESNNQGVYWKQNLNDWGWFSSKIVNHAGVMEAWNKVQPQDEKFIEEMKIWLITQKEVNSWGTSRGTAEVIFTILNSGKSWTSPESDKATIVWGGKELKPQTQATGYVKSTITSENIDKNLASITITKPGPGVVQGGLFWQYYEDLDKIKSSENYLSITKEFYKKIKTVNGEELQKISNDIPLKIGDKVTVRMILNTDRAMQFIHIKDMRAAGFEPLDVLSGYQWKNNLGYYQSTKDASTNFYIQYMPKGKYVFEYDVIANASGKFSNGITTLQNYYAPQMNAHTKGSGVVIKE